MRADCLVEVEKLRGRRFG